MASFTTIHHHLTIDSIDDLVDLETVASKLNKRRKLSLSLDLAFLYYNFKISRIESFHSAKLLHLSAKGTVRVRQILCWIVKH